MSESQLMMLLDERDIVAVATRYCRALDTKDWALLGNVFLPDATADLASTARLVGLDAIVGRIRTALENMDETQHLVGNHEIAVDGDSATHRCYLQAQHVRLSAAGGPHYIVAGRYEDRLVRTAIGWRIAHRALVVMWTEGNVAVSRRTDSAAKNPRSDLSNLTPRADELLAIEACREAARRYSYGVDRLDGEVMKSAYWPDGTDEHGRTVANAWEFCDRVVSTHAAWTWTMHTIFSHRVEIDPDGTHARGEVYNVSYLFSETSRRLETWYGRYLDAYERRGDEWRIQRRVCVHHSDTSQHLPDSMGIDASQFRQASFDRPANQRPIGP